MDITKSGSFLIMQGSFFLRIVLTDLHLIWRLTNNSIKSLSFIQQSSSALSFISFQQLEAVYWVLYEDGTCYAWFRLLVFFG